MAPGVYGGSILAQIMSPGALEYAQQADPSAPLFYDDYGQQWLNVRLDSMIALLSGLKSRGIPVSGVGMQMHINIAADTAGISEALRRLASTGLMVHIAELDLSVNPNDLTNIEFAPALQQQQKPMRPYVIVLKNYCNTRSRNSPLTAGNLTGAAGSSE